MSIVTVSHDWNFDTDIEGWWYGASGHWDGTDGSPSPPAGCLVVQRNFGATAHFGLDVGHGPYNVFDFFSIPHTCVIVAARITLHWRTNGECDLFTGEPNGSTKDWHFSGEMVAGSTLTPVDFSRDLTAVTGASAWFTDSGAADQCVEYSPDANFTIFVGFFTPPGTGLTRGSIDSVHVEIDYSTDDIGSITISPASVELLAGQSQVFSTGISATFEIIESGGDVGTLSDVTSTSVKYTAGATGGTFHVRAVATEVACAVSTAAITNTTCETFSPFSGSPSLLARTISDDMLASLASGATSMCLCVLVTRKDNVKLGFTTHDEDLTFGGVTYEALSSVQATTLRQQSGTGIDNMDVTGLLSSDRITESDLRAQRYDGAEIKLYIVDWANIGTPCLILKGRFGELSLTDGQYRAEIRSLMQRYAQQTGKLTSPTCRWFRFCDSNCGLNIASFTFPAIIDSLGSVARVFYASATGTAFPTTGRFEYGVARSTSGDNIGVERELKLGDMTGTSRRFELQEPFPYPISVGDTFDIEQGCDRTKDVCLIYNNIVNFGGEPYVPGTDKLQRIGRHKT